MRDARDHDNPPFGDWGRGYRSKGTDDYRVEIQEKDATAALKGAIEDIEFGPVSGTGSPGHYQKFRAGWRPSLDAGSKRAYVVL